MNAAFSRRLIASLKWEVVLQFRNGFYYAVGFILAFWVILFTQLPHTGMVDTQGTRALLPGLLLGNLLVTTFYFMAGLVMLEKAEGSLEARVVSPLRSGEYLAVKVIALALLVLLENLIIAGLFSGFQLSVLPFALGLLLSGTFFSLAGFLAVVRYDSINEFLMPSMPYVVLLLLPLLDFFGIARSPLFYLHPVRAALLLMEGGVRSLNVWEWLYGVGYALIGTAFMFELCRRAFRRFVNTW